MFSKGFKTKFAWSPATRWARARKQQKAHLETPVLTVAAPVNAFSKHCLSAVQCSDEHCGKAAQWETRKSGRQTLLLWCSKSNSGKVPVVGSGGK